MSLTLIRAEIQRLLATSEPEVLCIKGKWGVGKTYAWKKYLEEAQATSSLALPYYSYVSLFGLNSLEALRFSIFENTVTGAGISKGPDTTTFGALFAKGNSFGRRMRPLIDAGLTLFNRKGVGDILFKSAFLAVREQLVCLDDLERAGSGLNTRDVLGLASFLKEDRKCKVILLLNDERMNDDDRKEFNRQLEKVADTTMLFDLSPNEATQIAIPDTNPTNDLLRLRIAMLGITNIRVIKKIERLALRLTDLLESYDAVTMDQGLTALVLGGWSVYQPDLAPPLNFIRSHNQIANAMRAGREDIDEETKRFREAIRDYPYKFADDFDSVIFDGVEAGYFDTVRLIETAGKIEAERRIHSRDNEFTKAWGQLYHGSLATGDEEFLDALFAASIAEAKRITPLNINSAIRILRDEGRDDQANEVIAQYIKDHGEEAPEFFDISNHHFTAADGLDEGLREAFERQRAAYVDGRDPLAVLRSMGERRGWGDADIALMAKQSADDFERMFEELRGESLKPSIEMILAMGRSREDRERTICPAVVEALRRIARKSPLRAQKIEAFFGVKAETDAEGEAQAE